MGKFWFAKFLLSMPLFLVASKNIHKVRLRCAPTSRGRTCRAVGLHYDLPAHFFRLWMGEGLKQTCVYFGSIAYFGSMQIDLEAEQLRKLDYLCKKSFYATVGSNFWVLAVLGVEVSDQCRDKFRYSCDSGKIGPFDKAASVGAIEHFIGLQTDSFSNIRYLTFQWDEVTYSRKLWEAIGQTIRLIRRIFNSITP